MKISLPIASGHSALIICCVVALLASVVPAFGQGLYKTYPGLQAPIGYSIRELPNGNYRLGANSDQADNQAKGLWHVMFDIDPAGVVVDSLRHAFPYRTFGLPDKTFLMPAEPLVSADSVITFYRLSAQLDTIWSSTITVPENLVLMEWEQAVLDATGNLWVAGAWFSENGVDVSVILLKFTPAGTLAWQSVYPVIPSVNETSLRLQITSDQGCLFKIVSPINTTRVYRVGADGHLLWMKTVPGSYGGDLVLQPDDRCLLTYSNSGISLNAEGDTLFKVYFALGQDVITSGAAIATSDGGWAVMGRVALPSGNHPCILKLSALGVQQWLKTYDIPFNQPRAGSEAANGDLLWTGDGPFLIRTDSNGVLFKNHLSGRIAYDANLDCAVQPAESGLPGWILKLENTGATQYSAADSSGRYYFAEVDTGAQALTPIAQNYLWQACASAFAGTIPADSSDYTLPLDAPMQSLFDCPVMSLDLATPRLRRCFNNTYALHCCNFGNQTATDAYAEVYLPPHLLVQGASQPFTQDGLKLSFPLGAVDPFQCIDIQLVVKPDCDSTETGQSMCVSAHVFPDTVCGAPPGWSGALIEVSGSCAGDSVQFHIQNTGNAPTSQPLDFIVIDDHVMTLQGNYSLAAHASRTETFPADGSTWRLQSEQEPNAPGAAMPSVAVEGCATGGGPFSTGFVTQWPNENGSPFWERDCHTLINSYDPNAKQAAPAGVDAPHWILPNTPLEYLIEFQNTGNDTAFTVVLRDTLAPTLDPGSVRPGASSHPYTWGLSGAGILTFRFDNILLPDSTTNEPASHGFVRFRVQQQPDLPDDTHIDNRAGIYFDFNAPVLTNTVFHTVGRDFLPMVGLPAPPITEAAFNIYPNPARESVWVVLKNGNASGGRLTLSDAYGRVLARENVSGKTVEIKRLGRAAGVYWLRWEGADGKVCFQKMIWE